MTSDAPSPRSDDPARTPPPSVPPPTSPPVTTAPNDGPVARTGPDHGPSTTRAAAAWLATAAALVVLVLLIVLILQNQGTVQVHYLGLTGSLPLGTALLIAAVAGGAIVLIVGVVRLTQLRVNARRVRRREADGARRAAAASGDVSTAGTRARRPSDPDTRTPTGPGTTP